MKKAILTFGMFSLMMVLTSFTTNELVVDAPINVVAQDTGGKGGQQVPPSKGLNYDTKGGQQVPPSKGINFREFNEGQQMPQDTGL